LLDVAQVAGKECTNCERVLSAERFKGNWCRPCFNRKARERYATDAAFRAMMNARNRAYGRANSDRDRARRLHRTYGLSVEDFEEAERRQDGKCLICGTAPNRLYVDHDHSTGRVRGLLCSECNLGLGKFKDNPDVLLTAAQYLRNSVVVAS
jgi:hypothetical protein